MEQCSKTLPLIIFNYYVSTVNRPTSITRLGVLKMQQKLPVSVFRPPKYCCQFQNCHFQFLDPPKNCQFQFLDLPNIVASFRIASFSFQTPPKLPVSELPVSVFGQPPNCQFQFLDPPQNCQFQNCQFQFLDPPKIASFSFQTPPKILLPVSVFRAPPKYCCQFQFLDLPKYCCQFQNCEFQFLDPPSKLPISVFRPPRYCCQFQNCQFQFQTPQKLPVSVFLDPPNIVASFRIASFSFWTPPNCQFQFLDPPKILLPVSVLGVGV